MVFSGAAPSSVKFNIYTDHHKLSLYTNITQKCLENTIDVPVLPLDSMVKTHRFPAPYLVKIDVEGAGLEVLKGATETLTQTKAVVIEAFVGKSFNRTPDFGDLIIFMKERGFSVFDILAGSNRDNKLFQVDLVFITAH